MKKSILTIAGSALTILSAVQFAAASEPQQGRVHHRTSVRDSNAYAAPAYTATAVDIRRLPVAVRSGFCFSGGCSAATIVAWAQQLPNI
jgi:hypothetical protein